MIFIIRLILCCVAPPLAVIDKGVDAIVLVLLMLPLGIFPAVAMALVMCPVDEDRIESQRMRVEI